MINKIKFKVLLFIFVLFGSYFSINGAFALESSFSITNWDYTFYFNDSIHCTSNSYNSYYCIYRNWSKVWEWSNSNIQTVYDKVTLIEITPDKYIILWQKVDWYTLFAIYTLSQWLIQSTSVNSLSDYNFKIDYYNSNFYLYIYRNYPTPVFLLNWTTININGSQSSMPDWTFFSWITWNVKKVNFVNWIFEADDFTEEWKYCYDLKQNDWYNFINKSPYLHPTRTVTKEVLFNADYWKETLNVTSWSWEYHAFWAYDIAQVTWKLRYPAFWSWTFIFRWSNVPFSSPATWSISRWGWAMEYLTLYWSWIIDTYRDSPENTFRIAVITKKSPLDQWLIKVDVKEDFHYNERISLKNYTQDYVYSIIMSSSAYSCWLILPTACNISLSWIEYWTYETTSSIYRICKDSDWVIYRNGLVYTWSLDMNWWIDPIEEVPWQDPNFTWTWWIVDGINSIFNTFYEWWSNIKASWNNLIELIKQILEIWNTSEVRTLQSFNFFISKAQADYSVTNIVNSKIENMKNWDNPATKIFMFIVWWIIFFLVIIAIALLLI